MGGLLIVIGILAVLVLIVGFWVMSVYNGLVRTRNAKDNNYSQIGIQLTRKYDLIPNLVKLAKGYMKHERATLEEVIQARNQAANANATVSANPGDPAAMKNMVAAENSWGCNGKVVRIDRVLSRSQGEPEHDAVKRGADLD